MSVPQVQASAPAIEGPCTPSWMPTWAAAELGMILVTANGLTRAGPLLSMVAWVRLHAGDAPDAAAEDEADPFRAPG